MLQVPVRERCLLVRWGIATTTYAKPLYSVISKKVNGQIVAEEVEVYPGRTFNSMRDAFKSKILLKERANSAGVSQGSPARITVVISTVPYS